MINKIKRFIKLILRYIDPAYNLYIQVPPEIIKYRNKYEKEINLKIENWYKPSLFATASATAIYSLFDKNIVNDSEYKKITQGISNSISILYDNKIGGFRDKFDDIYPSIQGTRSALRLIRLLAGYSDYKWEKIDISSLLNDYLEDKNASKKIGEFVENHINEFDGGYTNFVNTKYSDIFSTSSANWILFQLNILPTQQLIEKYKLFSERICSITDNETIKCKATAKSSEQSLRATAQYIDLQNHLNIFDTDRNHLSMPKEWRIRNIRVQQCIVKLYNSVRIDIDKITHDSEIDELVKIILNSLNTFEYRGGYCFFQSRLLVPNILATYYALSILKKISTITSIGIDEAEQNKHIDFVNSCYSDKGLFRFYPYSRKYFRIDY